MNFQTIRYMAWAKRTHELSPVSYDLSTSAVAAPPAELLGSLDGLALAGNNAYGHPRLRDALAARYGVPGDRVLCSIPGASCANFLVAAALVQPGQTVLCEWPAYEPLWRVFEACGARLEWLERRPRDRFALDLGSIEAAFARGARALAISNPMNPTGTLLDPAAVRAAGEIAARHGGFLLVDEIYLDGAHGRAAARSAVAPGGAPPESTVVTSSLTKAYGLGGIRAGWAIAPAAVVARAYQVFDYLAVEQPYVADEIALRALERLPALAERARRIQVENQAAVMRWAEARSDVALAEPDGGFIAWMRLPRGWTSPAVEAALRARDAAVSPGHFFGAPDHVRVGFGMDQGKLAGGLERLGRVLDEAPPAPLAGSPSVEAGPEGADR